MQVFRYPTTIYFGEDAVEGLRDHLHKKAYKRMFLVTDPGLVATGIVTAVRRRLWSHGLVLEVFDRIRLNPTEDEVLAGIKAYKEGGFDGIIAVGGGSAIDTAKGIKILAAHPEPLSLYDDRKDGSRCITEPMPELFAIPTIASTGSEVGQSAVIIIGNRKTFLFHPDLMPRIAVLAPELTLTVSARDTAPGGMDAFVHCLEAYLVPAFDPLTDGMAKEGMAIVVEQLPRVMADRSNIEARGKMLMAACLGGAVSQKGLGMIHSLAHPLSCHIGMHHGLANALLLPAGVGFLEKHAGGNAELRKKLDTVKDILREVGFGVGDDETLSSALARFNQSVGIEGGLAAHGVKVEEIEDLTRDALLDPCHTSNAIPVAKGDFLEVYGRALLEEE